MKQNAMLLVIKHSEGREGRHDRMQQKCVMEEERKDVKEGNGRRCWNWDRRK